MVGRAYRRRLQRALKVAHGLLVLFSKLVCPRAGAQRLCKTCIELHRLRTVVDGIVVAGKLAQQDRPIRKNHCLELLRVAVHVGVLIGDAEQFGVLAEGCVVFSRLERSIRLVFE